MARVAAADETRLGPRDLVALIVSTRPYAAIDLVPLLLKHRITSIERGRQDALAFAQHLQPDFVIALVDPSRFDDLELVRHLSRATPAVLLVVSPTSDAQAAALRAGADVYLCDNDGPESLDAQIVALRRRALTTVAPEADEILTAGPLMLSRSSRRCSVGERELALTNMEFSLLLALVENQGRVLSSLQAARMSTGRLVAEADAAQTIKVYVRRLRQKLAEANCSPSLIVNVRGRGYMLDSSPAVPLSETR
jgi:DNA-binding response OmpR family regulator